MNSKDKKTTGRMTRREFGKKMAVSCAALSGTLLAPGIAPGLPPASPVVQALSPRLKRLNNDVNQEQAAIYLERALKEITGKSGRAAWSALFLPHERVGIKLSCLPGKPLSSSYGLVMAVAEGIRSAGVNDENIFIWERSDRELKRAGFPVGGGPFSIYGTDHLTGGGYSNRIEFAGSVGTCFSLLMERLDALVNIPVLKDHDIAGVSIGMKNFYGVIHNPNKFHGNNCDPFVADLCSHPYIKDKLRLVVCDASRIQVHNGPAFYPQYAVEFGGILVGRDPVALDYVGWRIIEEERVRLKLKSLKQEKREPKYIMTAARLKLGTADPGRINIIKI